jgi:predicted DNA-binding transcriptional regulator AlpA
MAAAYCGLSPATMRRLVVDDGFPAPVRLSRNRVAWLREQIDRWLDRKAGTAPTSKNADLLMTG